MSLPLTRLNLSRARLLLVDDDAQSMELLAQALQGLGVTQPRRCFSADEAERALAEAPFDLLLADQQMPGRDGLDLCRAVRREPAAANYTAPLILLTATPSLEFVAQARDAGAHFVVAKPISPTVLLQRIEWIARSRRAFVTSDGYRGPDRRFQTQPPPANVGERRAAAAAAAPAGGQGVRP